MCSCLLGDTGGVFMLVGGYWRFVHVCEWMLEVCSCLLVDTGGVFMFLSGCWRCVHVS